MQHKLHSEQFLSEAQRLISSGQLSRQQNQEFEETPAELLYSYTVYRWYVFRSCWIQLHEWKNIILKASVELVAIFKEWILYTVACMYTLTLFVDVYYSLTLHRVTCYKITWWLWSIHKLVPVIALSLSIWLHLLPQFTFLTTQCNNNSIEL